MSPRHVRATLLAPWILPAALLAIAVGTCLLALLEAVGALVWLALAVVVLGVHLALLWASVAALREQTERELVALQSRVTDLEAMR